MKLAVKYLPLLFAGILLAAGNSPIYALNVHNPERRITNSEIAFSYPIGICTDLPPEILTNYYDLSVISLMSPHSGCNLGSSEALAIGIANNGDSINNVTFSFSTDNGNNWYSETYSGWIGSYDTIVFCFQQHADLSTVGIYLCYFVVSATGDANSANDTFTVNITHTESPEITIFGLAYSYCINDPPVYVSGTPPGGVFTGLNDLFDSVGVHEVNYSFYDPVTECSGSKTLFINIYPAPEVDLGSDTVAYAPVELDAGTGMAGYQWNTGSGNHSVIAGSSGLYAVTVTNQFSCQSSDQINVTILNIPSPWNYSALSGYHIILLNELYSSDYTIDEVPIIPGDYIGVFYKNSQGLLQCGGYSVWHGLTTSLYAWFSSDPDAGFEQGEEFFWKIYDVSTTTEYIADATYVPTPPLPNQQYFQLNGLSGLTSLSAFTGTKIIGKDVTCHNEMNGAADLTVSTGEPPYSYLWSNGATTEDVTGLAAGLFMVTITDSGNQNFIDSIFIYEPPEIFTLIESTNVTYLYGTDGTANLTISGGIPPYLINWSNGAITNNLANLTGGVYSVVVTDSRGCTKTDSTIIHGICEIQPSDINDVSCYGGSNGSAQLFVFGVPPFSFIWSDGSTHEYIVDIPAGFYGVTLTDYTYCDTSLVIYISQPDSLSPVFDIHNADNYELNNGIADLSVSGGTSPYSFLWSDNSTTEDLDNLVMGTYFVTITDYNLCAATASATIGEQHILSLSGTVEMGPNMVENGISILVHYGTEKITSIQYSPINNGAYSFSGLYRSKYLVYAIPNLNFNFNYYPHYYPSYFGNTLYWESSEIINLDTSRNDVNISLCSTTEINFGFGKISGKISFLSFDDYEQDIYGVIWFESDSGSSGQRGAAMNIPVLLLDEGYHPVAFTLSDADGNYSFEKLAYGTYTVYPEKPGFTTHTYQVSISSENPEAGSVNFTIIPGIITGIDENNPNAFQGISIYPNPCKTILFAKLYLKEKEEVKFTIINLTGEIVSIKSLSMYPGTNVIPFDLSLIDPGLYMLSVQPEKSEKINIKFLKY